MTETARLVGRQAAAAGQVRITLGVSARVRSAHRHAGQFVELFPGTAERGYFALLNAPGEGEHLELLVRTDAERGGEAAALLVAAEMGSQLPLSVPLGPGFALERAEGKSVRVVATGTAIAPARAAIHVLRGRQVHVRSLDYGVRSGAHVALGTELERLRTEGADVAIHVSKPGLLGPSGALPQDALAARWTDASFGAEVIVVVGQPELALDVRTRWQARGGNPLDVLTNL